MLKQLLTPIFWLTAAFIGFSASAQSASTTEAKPTTLRLLVLPVTGEINEVTLESLRFAADFLEKRQAQLLILEIDSPGGRVDIANQVSDLLSEPPFSDARVIASIKNHGALSAAAIIAMSCKEILIEEGATLGAAVMYQAIDGIPENVDAKFESATVAHWQSQIEKAGWSGDMARAMALQDAEFYAWKNEQDELQISNTQPEGIDTFIAQDDKDSVLTLTAQQAIALGMSPAPASYDALAEEGTRFKNLGAIGKGMVAKAERKVRVQQLQAKKKQAAEQRKTQGAQADIAKLTEQRTALSKAFEEASRSATKNDPRKFRYTVYADNDKFTPASFATWWDQTKRAQEDWARAGQILAQLEQVESKLEKAGVKRINKQADLAASLQKTRDEWDWLEKNKNSQSRPRY